MIETKILAAQLKMSELRKGLEGFMSKLATDEIIKSEQIFQRTLTGGDFGVHNREPDLERAKIMMVHGRKYENIIRISRLKDSAGLWRR